MNRAHASLIMRDLNACIAIPARCRVCSVAQPFVFAEVPSWGIYTLAEDASRSMVHRCEMEFQTYFFARPRCEILNVESSPIPHDIASSVVSKFAESLASPRRAQSIRNHADVIAPWLWLRSGSEEEQFVSMKRVEKHEEVLTACIAFLDLCSSIFESDVSEACSDTDLL